MPRSVGGAENQEALVVAHVAIEFGEELIDQGPACAAAEVVSIGSQRIDFIEKKNRRRMPPCGLEKLVHALFGIAHPHVQNLMDTDGKEGRLDLARRRAREQRLAATWRTVEQHAAAQLLAIGLEDGGILERENNLAPDF